MATYTHLTTHQTIAMTFLVVISIFAGIPALIKVFKKGKCNFLATVFLMSMVSSFFYHMCEIYDFVPFLDRGQWQRMDNIFTISSIQLVLLFLSGCLHEASHFLQYSCLINTIIIQQKDPWNFNYTIWPIIIYLLLGLAIRLFYIQPRYHVKYFRRNMILSLIFLVIGGLFYFDGLDDENDYLRFSHGMWHLCVSVFGWFAFEGVEVTNKEQNYHFVKIVEDDQNQTNLN